MSKEEKYISKLKMQQEKNRLASFRDFPDHIPIIPSVFATAGFYCSKNPRRRDEVICFSCGCRLSDWSSEDDHHERHRGVSPRCPMVTDHSAGRRLAGNVPFGIEPRGELREPQHSVENTSASSATNDTVFQSFLAQQRTQGTPSQRDDRLELLKRESGQSETSTTLPEDTAVITHYIGSGDIRCTLCYSVVRMYW